MGGAQNPFETHSEDGVVEMTKPGPQARDEVDPSKPRTAKSWGAVVGEPELLTGPLTSDSMVQLMGEGFGPQSRVSLLFQ